MELVHRPYGLLAELTYRCPLHCPYCSNPAKWRKAVELDSKEWTRAIKEAAELGVLQIGFSGVEPLLRKDLELLIEATREAGLYTNLITSGVGLTEKRATHLLTAGLDNIQISFQGATETLADTIADFPNSHQRKLEAVAIARRTGTALSLNVVLHRFNIDTLGEIIALAENSQATRLESANTQYYGWAYRNCAALIPRRDQLDAAAKYVSDAARRLASKMKILCVLPDYFEDRPKPCMNGWGRKYFTINPTGFMLPCQNAWEIADIRFESVREKSVRWIWEKSESFNRFRGTEWMSETMPFMPMKEIDFAGCRCQAALLTGDASNTDPVCGLSMNRRLIDHAIEGDAGIDSLVFRRNS